MNALLRTVLTPWRRLVTALEWLQPLALLAARLHVAMVFFRSGLTKTEDWDRTLMLFTDVHPVPLLAPSVAAVAGTAGELVLPVLLVLGLGGRFAAMGLSVVNVVAAISLPDLSDAGLQQHVFWGSLLLGLVLWGPGPLSLERFIPWARAPRE